MNGHDYERTTGREVRERLREVAAGRRATVAARRKLRRERRTGWIFAGCCGLAVAAFISANLAYDLTRPTTRTIVWSSGSASGWRCVYGCSTTEAGWWSPRWSTNMDQLWSIFSERWLIGRRSYTTRDLMGRRA